MKGRGGRGGSWVGDSLLSTGWAGLLAASALILAIVGHRKGTREAVGPLVDRDLRRTLVSTVLGQTREELDKADLKATALFTGASLAATAVAVLFPPVGSGWLAVVLALLGLTFFTGLISIGSAIWPRIGRGQVGRADYFMDVVASAEAGLDIREIFQRETTNPEDRDIRELLFLSRSAKRKYFYLQLGMTLTGTGLLGAVLIGAGLILASTD